MQNGLLNEKRIKIIEYGWRCKMTNDDCDVVFDKIK